MTTSLTSNLGSPFSTIENKINEHITLTMEKLFKRTDIYSKTQKDLFISLLKQICLSNLFNELQLNLIKGDLSIFKNENSIKFNVENGRLITEIENKNIAELELNDDIVKEYLDRCLLIIELFANFIENRNAEWLTKYEKVLANRQAAFNAMREFYNRDTPEAKFEQTISEAIAYLKNHGFKVNKNQLAIHLKMNYNTLNDRLDEAGINIEEY